MDSHFHGNDTVKNWQTNQLANKIWSNIIMRKKTALYTVFIIFFTAALAVTDAHAWSQQEEAQSKNADGSYSRLVNKNLELREEIASLTEEYEKIKEMHKVLLEKVKTQQQARNELMKARAFVELDLSEQKKKVSKLEALLEERDAETRQRIQADVESEFMKKMSILEGEIKYAGGQKQRLERKIKELEEALEEARKTQEAQISALKEELGSAGVELKAAEEGKNKSDTRHRQLESEKESLEEELRGRVARVKALEKQLRAWADEYNRRLRSAQQEVKSAEAQISALKEELGSTGVELKAAEEGKNKSDTRHRQLESEKESLEEELRGRVARVKALEKELQSAEGEYNEQLRPAQQEVKSVKAKITELEKGLEKQKNILKEQEARLKAIKDENKELIRKMLATEETRKRVEREKEELAELKKVMVDERLNIHYNLAVVFDKNGMYEDAEREYLKCLKIDPHDTDVLYNLGILCDDKLNKETMAEIYYKKFLKLRSKGEDATRVREWLFNLEQTQRIGVQVR